MNYRFINEAQTEVRDLDNLDGPTIPVSSPAYWCLMHPEDGVAPEIGEYEAPPLPVPNVVSARQARLALLAAGKLDDVETAISAASQTVQITWEFANEIFRDDPLISAIAVGLGMSNEEIDALFVQAITY